MKSALIFAISLMLNQTFASDEPPKDLQLVKAKFESLVVPENDQEEMTLKLKAHQESEEDKFDARKLTLIALKDYNGIYVESIRTEDFSYSYERDFLDVLTDDIIAPDAKSSPFFCTALKELENEQEWGAPRIQKCRKILREIFSGITKGMQILKIKIRGSYYGTYEEEQVLIVSKEDSRHALRLVFDVVHEI